MNSIKEVFNKLEIDSKQSIWKGRTKFLSNEMKAYLEGKSIQHKKTVLMVGEWAWEELKKLELVCENVRKCRIHEYNLLKEIAIACLGEKEIKKRLSELK